MNRPAAALLLALLVAGIFVSGCAKEPESTSRSTNPEIDVARLFSYDGCIVYRFIDNGRFHYFTRCGSEVETMATWTQVCGKGCIQERSENIRTEQQ